MNGEDKCRMQDKYDEDQNQEWGWRLSKKMKLIKPMKSGNIKTMNKADGDQGDQGNEQDEEDHKDQEDDREK